MKDTDKQEFKDIITALGNMTRTNVDKMILRLYWGALNELTYDEFENAAMKAVQNSKFMPTPSDILEFAGKGAPSTKAASQDKANEAWVAVERATRCVGGRQSVDFSDPLANAAIRAMGGWISLCQRPSKDFNTWARKEFMSEYEAASKLPNPNVGYLEGSYGGEPKVISVGGQKQLGAGNVQG